MLRIVRRLTFSCEAANSRNVPGLYISALKGCYYSYFSRISDKAFMPWIPANSSKILLLN